MHDAPDTYQFEDAKSSEFGAALASIIKFPPSDGGKGDGTYERLGCSEQDCANIYELITTMAEHGKISLLFKQGHLKQLGAQLTHVHPLKFLSIVFKNPRLKNCMVDISNDYFKWNGFMDGIGPTLTREAEKGKLEIYLKDFSTDVGVPSESLKKYFQNRDWDGFVRYLMHHHD